MSSNASESFDEPEGANVEGALLSVCQQGILRVPEHQRILEKAPLQGHREARQVYLALGSVDGLDGGDESGIIGGQEEAERHHENGGIQHVRAVGLSKGLEVFVPALLHNFFKDLISSLDPLVPSGHREGASISQSNPSAPFNTISQSGTCPQPPST